MKFIHRLSPEEGFNVFIDNVEVESKFVVKRATYAFHEII